jgi:hypothetical protein
MKSVSGELGINVKSLKPNIEKSQIRTKKDDAKYAKV